MLWKGRKPDWDFSPRLFERRWLWSRMDPPLSRDLGMKKRLEVVCSLTQGRGPGWVQAGN